MPTDYEEWYKHQLKVIREEMADKEVERETIRETIPNQESRQ